MKATAPVERSSTQTDQLGNEETVGRAQEKRPNPLVLYSFSLPALGREITHFVI